MDRFRLGANPEEPVAPEPLRVKAPEIVDELKINMEAGAKKHCYEMKSPKACINLSDFLRDEKKDSPRAAQVMLDCCEKLQNSTCCWESAILRMNGFEKTKVERNFSKAVDDMKTACLSESQEQIFRSAQANACLGLAEIIRRDLTLVQAGQKKIHKKVKSLLDEMNVKSLAMKSCQMGNWEACNMYSILSLEGLFGVKKDIHFGVQLAEKSCYEGHELKSCVNLIKIHEKNLLGIHEIKALDAANLAKQQFHQISGEKFDEEYET